MPQGLSRATARIRKGAEDLFGLFRCPPQHPYDILPLAAAPHRRRSFLCQRLAGAVCCPSGLAAEFEEALARMLSMRSRPAKYEHRVGVVAAGGVKTRSLFQPHGHRSGHQPQARRPSSAQLTAANRPSKHIAADSETILETIPSGVVTLDSWKRSASRWSCTVLMGAAAKTQASAVKSSVQVLLPPESMDELPRGDPSRPAHGRSLHPEIELHLHSPICTSPSQALDWNWRRTIPARSSWLKTLLNCSELSVSSRGRIAARGSRD